MIPKIIHCCWFGGPKTKLALKCRQSWERFAPDFEIREWNAVEKLQDAVPPFVKEAMAQGKWAFAADWMRFEALYREGGVYLDYDLELIRPIDDLVEGGEFVNAHWLTDGASGIEASALALEKGSPIAKAMLDYYQTAAFDGQTTVGEILASLSDDLRVLPPEVLSPIDSRGVCHRTDATRGIHHYAMSWATPSRKVAKWLSWHGMRGLVELMLRVRA